MIVGTAVSTNLVGTILAIAIVSTTLAGTAVPTTLAGTAVPTSLVGTTVSLCKIQLFCLQIMLQVLMVFYTLSFLEAIGSIVYMDTNYVPTRHLN